MNEDIYSKRFNEVSYMNHLINGLLKEAGDYVVNAYNNDRLLEPIDIAGLFQNYKSLQKLLYPTLELSNQLEQMLSDYDVEDIEKSKQEKLKNKTKQSITTLTGDF